MSFREKAICFVDLACYFLKNLSTSGQPGSADGEMTKTNVFGIYKISFF